MGKLLRSLYPNFPRLATGYWLLCLFSLSDNVLCLIPTSSVFTAVRSGNRWSMPSPTTSHPPSTVPPPPFHLLHHTPATSCPSDSRQPKKHIKISSPPPLNAPTRATSSVLRKSAHGLASNTYLAVARSSQLALPRPPHCDQNGTVPIRLLQPRLQPNSWVCYGILA